MPFHHDDVGQPIWVIEFSNEIGCKQLVYFVHYDFISLKSKNPSFLLDWFSFGIYIQAMLNDIFGYVKHVFVAPGEDVEILLQELDYFSLC